MTENLNHVIFQVGDPIARALGVEILDIECSGSPQNPLVRITLDKDEGIGIDDCEQFHQSLRRSWEINQPSGPTCRFEVSSPGLDRPLKVPKDFQRVQGHRLRLTVQHNGEKQTVVIGRLKAVTESGLQLVDDRGKNPVDHEIEWADIVKAKIEIEF